MLLHHDRIQQIACSTNYSMILKNDSKLIVFGSNKYGQLGLEYNNNQNTLQILMKNTGIQQIAYSENHTMIFKNNGKVLIFGSNDYGQQGLGHYKNQNIPQLLV